MTTQKIVRLVNETAQRFYLARLRLRSSRYGLFSAKQDG